jgi:hypothetical protein
VDTTEFFGVLVVPVIIGLVEVAKGTGLSARWAAPLALALGLSASGLYAAIDTQLNAGQRRPAAGVRVRSSHGQAAGRTFRGDE